MSAISKQYVYWLLIYDLPSNSLYRITLIKSSHSNSSLKGCYLRRYVDLDVVSVYLVGSEEL